MTLEELIAEIEKINAEMSDLIAKAKPEGEAEGSEEASEGGLSDEDMDRYEALETKLRNLTRQKAIVEREKVRRSVVTPAIAPPADTRTDDDNRDLERAFGHYLRTGRPNADITQLRAQGEGVPSEGGFTVPDGFRQKLVERMKRYGGIAAHVENFDTETGNPVTWPTLDDTANEGEIVAEHGTFAAGADLVFGEVSLGAHKYVAGGAGQTPLRVSVELLQDSAFDIESLAARKLGERVARLQSRHLIGGTGVNQPKGLVHGKVGIELADDTAGITYDDLVDYIHAVDPDYRENGKWAFNDASLALIRKIKDSNGDPIWRRDSDGLDTALGGGVLLGYPVVIDQAFDNLVANDNTVNWGAFGDFEEGYVKRNVRDFVLIVNPWTRASNGQVEYTLWARMDGNVQNPNSYVALTGETP